MKKLLITLIIFNAAFAELSIQLSVTDKSFINEPYKPIFYLKNNGNETLLISAELTNLSLTSSPFADNPSSLPPNGVAVIGFDVEAPSCSDYLNTYFPQLNVSYSSPSSSGNQVFSFNFTVKKPLSINVIEPSLNNPLPVQINSFVNILILIKNEGNINREFNITQSNPNLLFNYFIDGEQYFNEGVLNKSYTINQLTSKSIKLVIIPSLIGSHDAQLKFLDAEGCINMTSSLNFTINSYMGSTAFFGTSTPSLSSASMLALLILIALFLAKRNLIK